MAENGPSSSTTQMQHGPSSSSGGMKHPSQAYHRKSQSLDASTITSHINGTPSKSKSQSHVRERLVQHFTKYSISSLIYKSILFFRFRCIVPYPPNSEFELELLVGDLVCVHKKRENGWYKGIHQRTGKTGLFPASFVEPDI